MTSMGASMSITTTMTTSPMRAKSQRGDFLERRCERADMTVWKMPSFVAVAKV
jgi:hypothetical protein